MLNVEVQGLLSVQSMAVRMAWGRQALQVSVPAQCYICGHAWGWAADIGRTSLGLSGALLRLAGIFDASLVSSMLPWKGLGMSRATALQGRMLVS